MNRGIVSLRIEKNYQVELFLKKNLMKVRDL